MTDVFMNRLLDAALVEAAKSVEPGQEFVGIGLALLVTAIGKLPPAEREPVLLSFEDGSLRRTVNRFVGAGSLRGPEEPYAARH